MGTRSLIAVAYGKQWKVAQYSQWDGGFDGQGLGVLKFLLGNGDVEKLRESMSKIRFLDIEGIDKEFVSTFNDKQTRTKKQSEWYDTFINRDVGSDILKNIIESKDSEIVLVNEINFSGNNISCEYIYVVDLDNNKFDAHIGCNQYLCANDYFENVAPPVYGKSYKFDNLPTEQEFLS